MKIAMHWGGVIIKLGIGCVVCLLLGVAVLLYAQEEKKAAFISTKPKMDAEQMKEMAAAKTRAMNETPGQVQPQRNRAWGGQNRGGGGVDFGENEAFYKTIIEYNLFRPLGWTPPNNEPSYSLIGTAVNSNGIISQATLLERRSNRYHFVTIGTKLDDMTVKDIQDGQVILDKAEEEDVTLKTGEFQPLTSKSGGEDNRGGGRGEGGSETARNSEGQRRAAQMSVEKRRQAEQKKREQIRRDVMEKLRNASSPEERREIMEWMRKEYGGDRGRRDRDR